MKHEQRLRLIFDKLSIFICFKFKSTLAEGSITTEDVVGLALTGTHGTFATDVQPELVYT